MSDAIEPPSDSFYCVGCRSEFAKARTDEEAKAEAVANGFDLAEGMVVVCDECYHRIMQAAIRSGLHPRDTYEEMPNDGQ